MRWNVALLSDCAWSDLSNVHIYEQAVVCVNLEELILGEIASVDIVLNINVLMRQDNIGVSVLVAWTFEVNNADIFVNLVGIVFEEETTVCRDLLHHVALKSGNLLFGKLIFEIQLLDLILNQLIQFTLDTVDLRVIRWILRSQRIEKPLPRVSISKHLEVLGLLGFVLSHLNSQLLIQVAT